jgi:hypothetical protein
MANAVLTSNDIETNISASSENLESLTLSLIDLDELDEQIDQQIATFWNGPNGALQVHR